MFVITIRMAVWACTFLYFFFFPPASPPLYLVVLLFLSTLTRCYTQQEDSSCPTTRKKITVEFYCTCSSQLLQSKSLRFEDVVQHSKIYVFHFSTTSAVVSLPISARCWKNKNWKIIFSHRIPPRRHRKWCSSLLKQTSSIYLHLLSIYLLLNDVMNHVTPHPFL